MEMDASTLSEGFVPNEGEIDVLDNGDGLDWTGGKDGPGIGACCDANALAFMLFCIGAKSEFIGYIRLGISFLFFLSCMASLSWASSLILLSINGYDFNTELRASLVNTPANTLVLATTVAVLGRLNKIPISPKKLPPANSAYMDSPSVEVTLTVPFKIQYIDFDGSPFLMMYSWGWYCMRVSLDATLVWNDLGALLKSGNVARRFKNSGGTL